MPLVSVLGVDGSPLGSAGQGSGNALSAACGSGLRYASHLQATHGHGAGAACHPSACLPGSARKLPDGQHRCAQCLLGETSPAAPRRLCRYGAHRPCGRQPYPRAYLSPHCGRTDATGFRCADLYGCGYQRCVLCYLHPPRPRGRDCCLAS